jgi:hypothetical protein
MATKGVDPNVVLESEARNTKVVNKKELTKAEKRKALIMAIPAIRSPEPLTFPLEIPDSCTCDGLITPQAVIASPRKKNQNVKGKQMSLRFKNASLRG